MEAEEQQQGVAAIPLFPHSTNVYREESCWKSSMAPGDEGHLVPELHSQVMPASEDDHLTGPCHLEAQQWYELWSELAYEEK